MASGASAPPARAPSPLRAGDRVIAVAPSSPFEHVLGWRGLGFLAERYDVRFTRGVFAREGFLAGTDARRTAELQAALDDPEARAIIAMRGGTGASRFGHGLSFAGLAAHPKWIVGYSDITVFHVEATRAGVASLHGPNLTALGRGDAHARAAFLRALEEPLAPRRYEGLAPIAVGSAQGPLFGGNLTMLQACAAAGRLLVPDGCILLLEDIGERPYRVDRVLATLAVGGHLARASGVVLGDFTDCPPGPDGVTVAQVLRRALARLGVPVASGLPVGHGRRNDPVVIGAPATLTVSASSGHLSLGEPGSAQAG